MKGGRIVLTAVLVLLQFCCSSLWARPTTPHQAKKVVTGWLKADSHPLGTRLGQRVMKVETFTNDDGEPVYYIVYLQPCGFVIVPADDFVEPIIGFVDGCVYDPSLDNPLGALVTNDLNARVAAVGDVERSQATAAMEMAFESQAKWQWLESLADGVVAMGLTSISDVRVAPLVQSKWGQKTCCTDPKLACYNYYTPPFSTSDGDPDNYVCGCTATAMAQVLRYHQHPTTGIGILGFAIKIDGVQQTAHTRGGDGSGGPYSWSDMVLVPDCDTTEAQRQAIGALCYDAGVSVNMNYSSTGSSAPFKDALTNIFKYGNAVKGYNRGSNIGPGLIGMINPNLDAKDPVMLGIGPSYMHAIVCDGYGYNSSTMYHHLNMGWDGKCWNIGGGLFSGNCDAWYNLPNIDMPDPAPSYTTVYACVYNIHVSGAGDGEMISGRVLDSNGEPVATATMYAQPEGEVLWITTDSDSKGIYAFDCLDSATTYTLYAVADGYVFSSQTVTTGISSDMSAVSGNVWGIDFYGQVGPPQPLFVDDDAPNDPGPGDPTISDPCEDGSAEHPFDAIQEAIDAAIPEDTVVVLPGTYTGDGNRDLDFGGRLITVRSANPGDPKVVAETVIDCNGTESARHRGFYFHSGETSSSVVAGFTITNGNANNGGGIYIESSSPKITNCTFSGNSASNGGGMYIEGSSPKVTNCTLSGNSASVGGGMYNNDSNPTLTNCIFSSSSASVGGGMYNNDSSPAITNCRFSGNQATAGGGMSNINNSNPTITNCTFGGNSTDYGGGMYSWDSTPMLSNCILWGDSPEEIYVYNSTPVITCSDVQGGWGGPGNINTDPCFTDPGNDDYHLKSQAGRWDPNSQSWIQDDVNSPCIDAGDPNSDWTGELWPHGKRINMGAYGGTPQASMSLSNAGNIANLDNDPADNVDLSDLSIFVSKWCEEQVLITEDLNRDGFVNFVDYAIFAERWVGGAIP